MNSGRRDILKRNFEKFDIASLCRSSFLKEEHVVEFGEKLSWSICSMLTGVIMVNLIA